MTRSTRPGVSSIVVSVPTRYFPEASSVNFRRSVVYGLATLNVARKFWLNKMGIRRYSIFRKRLYNIISREHRDRIFHRK